MARIDDDIEIGGKEYGSVRFRLSGDEQASRQLIGFGRLVLGNLKRQMQLGELTQLSTRPLRLKNGAIVQARSIFGEDGMADMDEILIFSPLPPVSGEEKDIGFIINVWGDEKDYDGPTGQEIIDSYYPDQVIDSILRAHFTLVEEKLNYWGGYSYINFYHLDDPGTPQEEEHNDQVYVNHQRSIIFETKHTDAEWDFDWDDITTFISPFGSMEEDTLTGITEYTRPQLDDSILNRYKSNKGYYAIGSALVDTSDTCYWTSVETENEIIEDVSHISGDTFSFIYDLYYLNRACCSFVFNPDDKDKRIVLSETDQEREIKTISDSNTIETTFPSTEFKSEAEPLFTGTFEVRLGLQVNFNTQGFIYTDPELRYAAIVDAELVETPADINIKITLLPSMREVSKKITINKALSFGQGDSSTRFDKELDHWWPGKVSVNMINGFIESATIDSQ